MGVGARTDDERVSRDAHKILKAASAFGKMAGVGRVGVGGQVRTHDILKTLCVLIRYIPVHAWELNHFNL